MEQVAMSASELASSSLRDQDEDLLSDDFRMSCMKVSLNKIDTILPVMLSKLVHASNVVCRALPRALRSISSL